MSDQRVGAAFRAVRIRRGWRQVDVALKAGVSSSLISLIERGHIGKGSLDALRSVAAVLDIRVDLVARWRGGELDRMLSEGHAALQSAVAAHLAQNGWAVFPEVSFAYYADRGSIDLLAWHAPSRTLLIVEIKTEVVDIPDMLHVADRKYRVAPRVARDRGFQPSVVATWLVVADSSSNRRRVARHRDLIRAAFPAGTAAMKRWVAQPAGRIAGLSFWANSNPGGTRYRSLSPKRVRVSGDAASHA